MLPRLRYVPVSLLTKVAYLSERAFERFGKKPAVTIGQIQTCAEDAWYDISAARRDLEYTPLYDTDAGIRSILVDVEGYMREIGFRGL